jgi:iron complex outermembrane receptor protein
LLSTGSTVGSTDLTKYTNLNLLAMQGKCGELPFQVPLADNITLWDKFGYTKANSTYRCATDYGRQFMLAAPKESINLVARGTMKLGEAHTAFLEFVGSETNVMAEFTPYQFSTTSNALTHYPAGGPHYVDLKAAGANDFDPTKPIAYRLRMSDWGYRTLENTSKNLRVAAGVDGEIGAYSYKAGLSYGQAEGSSYMHDGYADTNKLIAALGTGTINPFLMPGQEQTQAAKDLIESTKVRGRLFGGKTSVWQVDATVSGELFKLPGGPLGFALGMDLRKESYEFSGSQGYTCVSTFTVANAALPNSVMGCPGNASAPDATRNITAVYGELLVPLLKSLELQLAVRHDEYSSIGGTTNPKIAFKFQPFESFLMRGSLNTGFRAPTAQQLKLGQVTLNLTGQFSDPERCPTDPTQCARVSLPYRTGGNPTLQPETSTQGMLGVCLHAHDRPAVHGRLLGSQARRPHPQPVADLHDHQLLVVPRQLHSRRQRQCGIHPGRLGECRRKRDQGPGPGCHPPHQLCRWAPEQCAHGHPDGQPQGAPDQHRAADRICGRMVGHHAVPALEGLGQHRLQDRQLEHHRVVQLQVVLQGRRPLGLHRQPRPAP